MRLLSSILILPPNLNSLIRLASNQPQPAQIKHTTHHARLRIQGPRLRNTILILKPMSRLPIPKRHAPVVPAGEEHVILVHGNGVDDAVVAVEILHEISLGTEPLFYLTWGGGGEGVFCWVAAEATDALLVVGKDAHGFAGCEVVHADCAVETTAYYLRICRLGDDGGDGLFVAAEDVDVASCAHVPDSYYAVAAAGAEDIERGVEGEVVDAA